MNIFLTSTPPHEAAMALDNRRVIKMALETAQLLSAAVILRCGHDGDGLYGLTHYNHPCSRWCRRSLGNFLWLVEHGRGLCSEYRHRFGKTHKALDVIERCYDRAIAEKGGYMALDDVSFDFNSSAFKDVADPVTAYRKTMMLKWTVIDLEADRRGRVHPPKWSCRGKPSWYDIGLIS